jgi:hypothetical protein
MNDLGVLGSNSFDPGDGSPPTNYGYSEAAVIKGFR